MQTEIPHMQIKPEDLRKIQLKSLEMLLYFKEICDKNGLLFYFCGGCCIGALRNKGFIPWDDDVDIFMPRDRKSTRLNSSHYQQSRMPSSA